MNPQFWWYVTRASGIVAWLMLTASVIWGVVLSTKAFPEHRRPAWLLDLHRWLGGLTVCFLAIHLGSLVADNYTHWGIADLTVPFASSWKPGAVALGVLAAWLLVAVELTSLAMRRLPKRVWRGIHMTSYVTFWLTSLHAAFAGTDRATPLYMITAAASIVAVVWALMYRLSNRRGAAPPPRDVARPEGPDASTNEVALGLVRREQEAQHDNGDDDRHVGTHRIVGLEHEADNAHENRALRL